MDMTGLDEFVVKTISLPSDSSFWTNPSAPFRSSRFLRPDIFPVLPTDEVMVRKEEVQLKPATLRVWVLLHSTLCRPLLIGDEKKTKMTKKKIFFVFDPFFSSSRHDDEESRLRRILLSHTCSIIYSQDAISYTYHSPRLSWLRRKDYLSQET